MLSFEELIKDIEKIDKEYKLLSDIFLTNTKTKKILIIPVISKTNKILIFNRINRNNMNYIKALKIYNDRKGEKNEWCVYRKGTPEYLEVMKIMKDFKEKPIKEKAANTISNAIKIKKAKKELEILKLEKEKSKLENAKLEKAKKELEKNNYLDDTLDIFSIEHIQNVIMNVKKPQEEKEIYKQLKKFYEEIIEIKMNILKKNNYEDFIKLKDRLENIYIDIDKLEKKLDKINIDKRNKEPNPELIFKKIEVDKNPEPKKPEPKKEVAKKPEPKKEEININKDKNNQLFYIINDKYDSIKRRDIKKDIKNIKEKEEELKRNPRLRNIKQDIEDEFNYIIIQRKKMIENFEILNNTINEYISIYKNKIDYVYLYLTNTYRDIIIDMYVIQKNNQRDIDYIYDKQFYSYILKIADKQIKDGILGTSNSHYSTVEAYRKDNDPTKYASLVNDVFKEIRNFIYNFLNQNIYNNIQDYYDNNKNLYADINLYQKFIDYLNINPPMIKTDDIIFKLKEEINFGLIMFFKRDYIIKDENEIKERKKAEMEKWKQEIIQKEEEKRKEIPAEDKKIIIKLLDDCKIIIDKTIDLIKKNDIMKKINNTENNVLHKKLYKIFISFRHSKNAVSNYSNNNLKNYKTNIKKLKDTLIKLNEAYQDFLITLKQ
jgi:hypothetical protein